MPRSGRAGRCPAGASDAAGRDYTDVLGSSARAVPVPRSSSVMRRTTRQGTPTSDGHGRDVVSDDAARADDGAVPDANAGEHGGVAADPDLVLDHDGFGEPPEVHSQVRVDRVPGRGQRDAWR